MKPSLPYALRSALAESATTFGAIIFVRKEQYFQALWLTLDWHEMAACALAVVDGFAAGKVPGEFTGTFGKRVLRFALPAIVFFYLACSALCFKLHRVTVDEPMRIAGLVLAAAGVLLRIWSVTTKPAQLKMPAAGTISAQAATGELMKLGENDKASPAGANVINGGGGDSESSAFPHVVMRREEDSSEKTEVDETDSAKKADTETPEANEQAESRADSESGKPEVPEEKNSENTEREPEPKPETPMPSPDSDSEKLVLKGPWLRVRYPERTAMMLVLAGQALLLGSWLPLLALPGILVAIKWEIQDIETFRISQLGEQYLTYKKNTWALLPLLF